jgi:hypothetical protein
MSADNKVRVVRLYGAGNAIGAMNPRPNMDTQFGRIVALSSGNVVATVSGTNARTFRYHYPRELNVLLSVASGQFSWPSGDGSVRYGRNQIWPSGVTPAQNGSGMSHMRGDGTVNNFYR